MVFAIFILNLSDFYFVLSKKRNVLPGFEWKANKNMNLNAESEKLKLSNKILKPETYNLQLPAVYSF